MLKKNKIYIVVAFIGSLLVLDVILTSYNNAIIKHNKALQAETVRIDIYYDQIGKVVIQALDLGLRGYALVPEEKLAMPMQHALLWKDSIYANVENPLRTMHYPLKQFLLLKDSVNAYAKYCFRLKDYLDSEDRERFTQLLRKDKGGQLWWQYINCEKNISNFTNSVNEEAQHNYEQALFRNIMLQIIIFSITLPTLFYTAYKTQSAFTLSQKLNVAEADRNTMLREQNERLEHEVAKRTKALEAQNEEILSQSEELTIHRDSLEMEVQKRTLELQNTNLELVENNNQLEQFSFAIAHIIRAPLARILGLTNIVGLLQENEKGYILDKIQSSAAELDQVIKELAVLLQTRKHTRNLTEVDLAITLDRVLNVLEKEVQDTHAHIISAFNVSTIYANTSYIENILYNLISNSIKYRDDKRPPKIIIKSTRTEEFIRITLEDNGLGINLDKFGHDVFGLFKRFHFHVEGRGLGLYLTRIQVMALGGKIDVQSEVGKGTTFSLYFKWVKSDGV